MNGVVRRALSIAAAVGAVLAAAGVVVVALAYGLYAWMLFYMPPPAASAVVAGAAAVIAVAAALVAIGAASPPKPKAQKDEPDSLLDRALSLAKQKPLVAAGGALAAGLIALRNPALITMLLGLMSAQDGKTPKSRSKR